MIPWTLNLILYSILEKSSFYSLVNVKKIHTKWKSCKGSILLMWRRFILMSRCFITQNYYLDKFFDVPFCIHGTHLTNLLLCSTLGVNCYEFRLKVTQINLKVWTKKEVVIGIKVTSSNNNSNKPRSNLGTKRKTQNHKQKIKR